MVCFSQNDRHSQLQTGYLIALKAGGRIQIISFFNAVNRKSGFSKG